MGIDAWLCAGYVILLICGLCALAPVVLQVFDTTEDPVVQGVIAVLCGLVAALALVCWRTDQPQGDAQGGRTGVASAFSQRPMQAAHVARPDTLGGVGAMRLAPHKTETALATAQRLVGSRLSVEQAAKAAEKIIAMRPFVEGRQSVSLSLTWSFFEMPVPQESKLDPQDAVVQALKANLNRQRLLLHPDKNGHPDAERTFKFLEDCHVRLTTSFVRRRDLAPSACSEGVSRAPGPAREGGSEPPVHPREPFEELKRTVADESSKLQELHAKTKQMTEDLSSIRDLLASAMGALRRQERPEEPEAEEDRQHMVPYFALPSVGPLLRPLWGNGAVADKACVS